MAKFTTVAATHEHPLWKQFTARQTMIYQRENEIRSEFWRDYNRLLHSKAYRRLKHKTQVFFSTNNDHVCTRIEHVNHVCAVSYSIAQYLGLNTELVLAIAIGHDIGHAPFGHDGETILHKLAQQYADSSFRHEQNGLFFADFIELLRNEQGDVEPLNLTYAVRDGIVSHCGEVDERMLVPRKDYIDLRLIQTPNIYNPFTWEACVVKVADKISYLGRDMEDAIRLKIIGTDEQKELQDILDQYDTPKQNSSSNTALIHSFAIDLCLNSNPDEGIRFSEKGFRTLTRIKQFNYQYIYRHPCLNYYKKYANLIIHSIFDMLDGLYDDQDFTAKINHAGQRFPKLINAFEKWLQTYSDYADTTPNQSAVYSVKTSQTVYRQCIIGFISSMSDSFAIEMFNELTTF
jgi:dGTPase